jgi:hypothetical protein
MKTLGRIVIILVAALMVAGVAYAALSAAGSGQPIGQGESSGRPTPPDQANGFSSERIDRGHDQAGSFETVVSNFLMIAVVVVIVQGVWAIGRTVDKHYAARS